jgi:hypothetical protein
MTSVLCRALNLYSAFLLISQQKSVMGRQYLDEPSSSGSEDGDGHQHSPSSSSTLSKSSSGSSQVRDNRQSRIGLILLHQQLFESVPSPILS